MRLEDKKRFGSHVRRWGTVCALASLLLAYWLHGRYDPVWFPIAMIVTTVCFVVAVIGDVWVQDVKRSEEERAS